MHPHLTHTNIWNTGGTLCLLIATPSRSAEERADCCIVVSFCGEYELQCISCEPTPPARSVTACRTFSPKYQSHLFSRVFEGPRLQGQSELTWQRFIENANRAMFGARLFLGGRIHFSVTLMSHGLAGIKAYMLFVHLTCVMWEFLFKDIKK